MVYQRKESNFFKKELARLKLGNVDEKKRRKTINEKISAVLLDPTNSIYAKKLPDNYCAVDVGERYRLFFKVFQQDSVVYFSWINDEKFLHKTGSKHDCYVEFTRMFHNSEIEAYIHEEFDLEEDTYRKSTGWGQQIIYVKFDRKSNLNEYSASSHLQLSRASDKQYKIQSISVDEEGKGLAKGLLSSLTQDADQNEIEFFYELILSSNNIKKSQYLLNSFGFKFYATEDDVEVWIRPASKK